ncbi:iron-sulfur cluster assembly accessory protein [Synechococcus sp. PCC 6312]|uniref:HesB/IscA family protein n=1 Tax=Synechococcus sp. (strain ATCC 27167 / PCC 6312) TaxID=195253 RepID=UPI00029EE10E|nr:iron-sulfur cluster assembly accessory protein [Synechococcus sp. PCC 6312]AFY62649.1 Iron-sulfur cluster assembly accessory protein [Synechococcus sp. PCC 6312]
MTVTLTPAAVRELERLRQKSQAKANGDILRLGVKSGGCADWLYVLEFTAAAQPNDFVAEISGLVIAVAADSVAKLTDLNLDYTEDLMGGAFRFHNPIAGQTCGCGLSFKLVDH